MQARDLILVEHGPEGKPAIFRAAERLILAYRPEEVMAALESAEAERAMGKWIAGYVAYEAGFALEAKLAPLAATQGQGPLVALGVYDAPQSGVALLAEMEAAADHAAITAPEPQISRAAYDQAITKVLDYIAAGDCYQVNLTFPLRARLLSGDAFALYGALRRRGAVGHGAYVDLGQGPVVVSRSPELFFTTDAKGKIEARPMKGTRPRDADPQRDRAIAAELQANPKDRAENLMIVDLLRNDISRIAKLGSVKVPALFSVEHYATVHQMTSTIRAELSGPVGLPALMTALFPCGSVTGAPKIRAMEIIHEVERAPRGIYCGAVGWMAPDGRSDFSVAIRTLSIFDREIVMNVGGGIVHDSTPQGEWEEALWKARFVKAAETPR